MKKRTYTIAEAAELTGLTRKALARRVERGSLQSLVRGGRRMIPHAELVRAGLIVDEILGVERLKLASLQPALSGREFVRGVAPGPTVLLDLDQLLTSGRFDVLDELL